jgi:hypothetical protein
MTAPERDQGAIEYRYQIVVSHDLEAGRAVAYVDDPGGPLLAYGETPVLALSALSALLAHWPNGGREEWTRTTQGQAFLAECRVEFGVGTPRGKA